MTRARWTSGESDDRDRIVETLRRALLVPRPDAAAAAHLEAMLLERDFDLATDPVPESEPRRVHRPRLRARTFVGAGMLAATLSLTSGFAAAGALPATAQHWISRATRVIGIPLPDAPPSRSAPPRAARRPARQPLRASAPTGVKSGARPTPDSTNGTRRAARFGGSVPPTGASQRGGTARRKAAAGNVKVHGPAHAIGRDNGNGKAQSAPDNQSDGEGGQTASKTAPKAAKAEKKAASNASKKADKKSGSAAADDHGRGENGVSSARGSKDDYAGH